MKVDMNKFSFAQMTSNSDGKTSGSGTLGLFAGFAGILAFLFGAGFYSVAKDATIMNQAIIVLGIGAGLLGYRKSKESSVSIPKDEPKDEVLNEEIKPI